MTQTNHSAAVALAEIFQHNKDFADAAGGALKALQTSQHPHEAVVMCSDSRCPEEAVSGPELNPGETFTAMDAGNPAAKFLGGLGYAVDHLGVTLITVVGHTGCGAIKAATAGGYEGERAALVKDLDALKRAFEAEPHDEAFAHLDEVDRNVIRNIRAQCKAVRAEFADKVTSGDVVVAGLLFDLHNVVGGGEGKLYLDLVNDVHAPEALMAHPLLAEMAQSDRHSFLLRRL